jgi:hypothetical protein
MGGCTSNLSNRYWFLSFFKTAALCLAFTLFLTLSAIADTTVYKSGTYTIWDSPNCLSFDSSSNVYTLTVSSRDNCLSAVSGEPLFSDTFDSQFSGKQKTIGVALLLVLWPELFSFFFLCLLLLGFLLVLPG